MSDRDPPRPARKSRSPEREAAEGLGTSGRPVGGEGISVGGRVYTTAELTANQADLVATLRYFVDLAVKWYGDPDDTPGPDADAMMMVRIKRARALLERVEYKRRDPDV
jgi:hypothetical protein